MKRWSSTFRLIVFLLIAPLLPFTCELPLLPAAVANTAQPTAREASSCEAIRARIKKVSRQLKQAGARGQTTAIRRLRRQLRKLRRQLADCLKPPTETFVDMVTVGNPGNAADLTTYGAVSYEFQIGKYEVTLAQYIAFLNAVAATDTYGLYHTSMATDLNSAGIDRSGSPGSFTYSVIGTETRPVTYVSWFDAARFCNWLHNGRPTGAQDASTTERGAYTLDGAMSGGFTISRNFGANFWIPSEDEWYKAAYHQPSAQGGDSDNYWLYPTRSNTVPGNTVGPLPLENQANHHTAVYSVTQNGSLDSNQNYLTAAGVFPGSASFYGTLDQGGNVFEWNDSVLNDSERGLRGGSWNFSENSMRSPIRNSNTPTLESNFVGFRVASP